MDDYKIIVEQEHQTVMAHYEVEPKPDGRLPERGPAEGLIEQYPIKFATTTHRADFALFIPGKETPEIIVELKRPKKKKEEK